jgi:O-antigen/teichoic acid export membrane protein
MSRTRRLVAGFGVTLLNQVLVAAVGLFVTRYVLHRIGEQDYGLWIVGGQFLAYLGLLDLGVMALLPREVGLVTGKNLDDATRASELRGLVGRSASLVLLLVPPLALASLGLVLVLPAGWAALRWPLAISLAAFVATYPLRIAHSLLTGLQDFAFLGWVQMATWALNIGVTLVLVRLHFGLYAVALGPAVGQLASAVGWIARVLTKYRDVVPRRVRWFDRGAIRAHLAPGLWVSLNQVAQMLLNNTDVVVIGNVLGPAAVVPYSFTDKLQTFFNNQPYAIAQLAGPALSEVKASGEKTRIARAIGALSVVVLVASGGISVAVLAVNHAFVALWVGEEHFAGMTLTALLLSNMLVRHWTFTYLTAIFYFGREREYTILAILDGVLTVVLSVVFVRSIGLPGAALGPLVSVLVTQLPASLWLLARDMGTSPGTLFLSAMPWLLRFAPIVVVAGVMARWLGARSLVEVAAMGGAVGVVYAATMLPILRRPPCDVYAQPLLRKLGLARKAPEKAE